MLERASVSGAVVRRVRRLDCAVLLVIVALAAWGVWQAQRVLRADFLSMRARYQVDSWMTGHVKWTVPEWVEARDRLLEARALTPDNPVVLDYLGVLNALRGEMGWRNEGVRRTYFEQAMSYQQASLRLRWHNGSAWSNLALSQYALGDHQAALSSLRSALMYGPNELRVKRLSSELVLAMWGEASVAQREWVRSVFLEASASERKMLSGMSQRYGVVLEPRANLPGVSLQP